MDLFEQVDAARERWNVLRHPFYLRWEAGELSRELVGDGSDAVGWDWRIQGAGQHCDHLLVHCSLSGNARKIASTFSTNRTVASSIWSR